MWFTAFGFGFFSTITFLGSIAGIIVSWLLFAGIQEVIFSIFSLKSIFYLFSSLQRSHTKIHPSRVLAILGYILVIPYIIYIANSGEDLKKVINLGIDDQIKLQPYAQRPSDAQIDAIVSGTVGLTIFALISGVILDFVIRYLVIESLYQKYRDESAAKPRQNV